MKVLFVNACIRGQESRTLRLCRAALDQIQETFGDVTVEELVLDNEEILPLNSKTLAMRHDFETRGDYSHPMFRFAKQFAGADLILFGAPYWEYQFPALLRCYLEQISVGGVTFAYGEDGRPHGLCQGDQFFYITTAGGPILGRNCGFDYIKTLCGDMMEFKKMDYTAAECLDVWGEDVEGRLQAAEAELREKIKGWKA